MAGMKKKTPAKKPFSILDPYSQKMRMAAQKPKTVKSKRKM